MSDTYRYTREEVLELMAQEGMPRMLLAILQTNLLELAVTEKDMTWALRIGRKQRFVGKEAPCEPFYNTILAMDT